MYVIVGVIDGVRAGVLVNTDEYVEPFCLKDTFFEFGDTDFE